MISRDPRCVFVADDQYTAALVMILLGEAGIKAEIINDVTADVLDNITLTKAGSQGMEIWVHDESQAEAGREVLSHMDGGVLAKRAARATRTGDVDIICPSCKKKNVVPAAQQGTVQSCVYCGEFIDIPDPDDSTEWPEDFGRPDDELEGGS